MMASAYGGVAKPRLRKANYRFATVARDRDRDRAGIQTSHAPKRPPRVGNLVSDQQTAKNMASQPHILNNTADGVKGDKWNSGEVPISDRQTQAADATTMRT